MTRLIIARHGNTFNAGETPRRVGGRTDLPLVASGREQARNIGHWLKTNALLPEVTYCSDLLRTRETAELAIKETGYAQPIYPLSIFNEIDYGPDENKEEADVIARIGAQAIEDWDKQAVVPDGWAFNPQKTIADWQNFANHIVADDQDIVFVVTSNGIARFAPYITGDFDAFAARHSIKISTGAICLLEHSDGQWHVRHWNMKP
jgi:2,3-bisphosphoglycerate-dependent phosphoglycerate mutase